MVPALFLLGFREGLSEKVTLEQSPGGPLCGYSEEEHQRPRDQHVQRPWDRNILHKSEKQEGGQRSVPALFTLFTVHYLTLTLNENQLCK